MTDKCIHVSSVPDDVLGSAFMQKSRQFWREKLLSKKVINGNY